MVYEGYIDSITRTVVSGWAYAADRPDEALSVELIVNAKVVATFNADTYREDLFQSGYGNGRHGFALDIAKQNIPADAQVRIVGAEFYLKNNAIKLRKKDFARLINSTLDGAPKLKFGFSAREIDAVDREIAVPGRTSAPDRGSCETETAASGGETISKRFAKAQNGSATSPSRNPSAPDIGAHS